MIALSLHVPEFAFRHKLAQTNFAVNRHVESVGDIGAPGAEEVSDTVWAKGLPPKLRR